MNAPDFSMFSTRDVADVALQRTENLLRFPAAGPVSFLAWERGFELPLLVEARLARRRIMEGAWSNARSEWAQIAPYVPVGGVLCDIGCGHALIDLVAWRERRVSRISLVDIERTADKAHAFRDRGAGYANLEQATLFLRGNGVEALIETCNPMRSPLPAGPFDCITSILSAGFHYPIAEYTRFALDTLRPGGVLIFDMRDGTGQESALSEFAAVETIGRRERSSRIAARKG